MSDPLHCECGCQTFRDIAIREHGIIHLTCCQCRQTRAVSVSAMAAEAAWNELQRAAPDPEPAPEPMRGYRYGGLL